METDQEDMNNTKSTALVDIDDSLWEEIDKARGSKSRQEWIEEAILNMVEMESN